MHNTLDSTVLRSLHGSLIDIVGVMNRPQGDQAIIDAAGVAIDRALFPLLVLIDRRGPIGVVDLADRVGRDYTTVSRQIAKLKRLGLIERRAGPDRRVHETVLTPSGRVMNAAIDEARERLVRAALSTWSARDLARLDTLLARLATAMAGRGRGADDQAGRPSVAERIT